MMSCAYVISRFGPSITRLAGRTRPERWENAYELRKSGLTSRGFVVGLGDGSVYIGPSFVGIGAPMSLKA